MDDDRLMMITELKPDEPEPEPPIIVILTWSCGLAVGPPEWQGTDIYECPECMGDGEIALPFDALEIEDGKLVGIDQSIYCTFCHQQLEEMDHFDGVRYAIERAERIRAKRSAG